MPAAGHIVLGVAMLGAGVLFVWLCSIARGVFADRRQRNVAKPDVHVDFVAQHSALGWIGIHIHLINRTGSVWDLMSAEARPLRRCRLATKFIREGPMPGAILRIPPVNLEASFAAATRGPIECRTRVNPAGTQPDFGQPGDQAQCRLFLLTDRSPRFVSLRLTLRSLEANISYRVTFKMAQTALIIPSAPQSGLLP